MKKENAISQLQLNIVDICPLTPDNYHYQVSGWFGGQTHLIQSVGAAEVNDMGDYSYQIEPFIFQDETAVKATGAHFFIPEGKASNVILFTGEDYKWRIRAVSGSGWILAWHPEVGVQQAWLSPDLEQNPVIEFGENWIACLIASQNCGQFIVEGIDIPEYKPEAEQVIYGGNKQYPLPDFWEAYERLTDSSDRTRFMDSGR